MRTVLVVPADVADEFFVEFGCSQRNEDLTNQLGFECSVESLDDGDGAVLSEGAETGFDAMRVAPEFVGIAELSALVADDVLWGFATKGNGQVERFCNGSGIGGFAKSF